jgi:ribonucleoside-diphosphate reductase beta chain
MNKRKIYNPESKEALNGAMITGGEPAGICNFTKPTHKWSLNLYNQMLANTWFPEEANTARDKNPYARLTPAQKRMYDLVLAQLIFNDSEQTENLVDNITPYITDPIVNACLVRQAFEETLHSKSYAVMAEDISANTDEIYELFREDEQLNAYNTKVAKMYEDLADDPSEEALQMAFVANNVLEGIVFYPGFVALWSLGDTMQGSASMISFIARDEKTHLALFKNIFRTNLKQWPYLDTPALKDNTYELVSRMVDAGIEWLKYVTDGQILGFNDMAIEQYIRSKGNMVMTNMGYEEVWDTGANPLLRIEKKYDMFNDMRTNFFEGDVKNYAKGSIDMDF